ncbi:4-alpha-glucanotransferase [Thermomicrobium sp. 4228-Ro]|uniref:4-alpha-glucanotransferase n=1 Tax=Thermomicrobium sp. 4228-Ro TaxID=2993937 RepID=UPI002248779E|nr:4-alpha-glucanotransferase [Thermomicrobium sp. 4228-Ro]MCX2727264.1 4-alpha-glucanotransferase [Thermomicrobium sp. 4228-Ro]
MMKTLQALHALARTMGVQLAYRDIAGQRHVAGTEQLIAVLQALGLPIERPDDAPRVLRAYQRQRLQRGCEPVHVWVAGRGQPTIHLLATGLPTGTYTVHVRHEDGTTVESAIPAERAAVAPASSPVNGVDSVAGFVVSLPLPWILPLGYHEVTMHSADGTEARTLLMVRPPTVVLPEANGLDRSWGTFLPLYALWRDQPRDGATYSRLQELVAWTRQHGGQLVGTLPLLPVFLGEDPFDPSPYAPISRLFWNEFYCDVASSLQASNLAAPLVTVAGERGTLLVDYAATWRQRRTALATLAERLQADPERWSEIQQWLEGRPDVQLYARFRAAVDQYGPPSRWPGDLRRDRTLAIPGLEEGARMYLVGQWLATHQLGASEGSALYLDLPLGVHPEGFDVWSWPELFVTGMSAGAPPDPFFAGGQVWGFPPLHPERIREDGYRYVRAVLAHHLGAASLLRIDHVMGFHRLYWVPSGASGREGVYVRYRPEEFYAVLAIESQRAGCAVAGEDLGTVPQAVRHAMVDNGLLRLWVLPFEQQNGSFREPPGLAVASLETHDLPPFAALWEEWGPERQEAVRDWLVQRGYIQPGEGGHDPATLLRALLRLLGSGPAAIVLVNLEDLWLEREPQNRPGTGLECPNWRRLARRGLADLAADRTIGELLATLDRTRKGGAR